MRVLTVGAALAVGLACASHAWAGDPTNVKTLASAGNGFDFGITKLLSAVTGTGTSKTTAVKQRVPIARPQPLPSINRSLAGYLPSISRQSAKPTHGMSIFPSEDQLPGAGYLKAFGLKVAPRVPLN